MSLPKNLKQELKELKKERELEVRGGKIKLKEEAKKPKVKSRPSSGKKSEKKKKK